MKSPSKFRSCFLTAPMNVDVLPIWNILESKNIQKVDYKLESSYGSELSLRVEEAIHKAGFVFAILFSGADNRNIYFELGIAFAKNKPIFLLVDSSELIPVFLRDIFYVQAKPTDFEAIKFNLEIFLEHHKTRINVQRSKGEPSKKTKKLDAEVLFDEAKRAENEKELTIVLKNAFGKVGYLFEDLPNSKIRLADIAVWIDQIQSSIGNPVLIEVKAGLLTENRFIDGLNQLRTSLLNSGGRVGLLIYQDERGLKHKATSSGWPLVIALSIDELLSFLANGSLADFLIDERNRIIHGEK